MDLPFNRRVLFHMTNGLLVVIAIFSPVVILAPYLYAPIPFQKILLYTSIAPLCGLLGPFLLYPCPAFDPELSSTWRRTLLCISILVAGLFVSEYLRMVLSFDPFSNGFKDPETCILLVVWVLTFLDRIRVNAQVSTFSCLLRHAQRRFPYVERRGLLKLAARAMRCDGHVFINNYEFPAAAG